VGPAKHLNRHFPLTPQSIPERQGSAPMGGGVSPPKSKRAPIPSNIAQFAFRTPPPPLISLLNPCLLYRFSIAENNRVLSGVEGRNRILDPLSLLGHDLAHCHLGLVKGLETTSDKCPQRLVLFVPGITTKTSKTQPLVRTKGEIKRDQSRFPAIKGRPAGTTSRESLRSAHQLARQRRQHCLPGCWRESKQRRVQQSHHLHDVKKKYPSTREQKKEKKVWRIGHAALERIFRTDDNDLVAGGPGGSSRDLGQEASGLEGRALCSGASNGGEGGE